MEQTPLGVGIIGCGAVATSMHINGWTRLPERVRLVAAFDVDQDRLDRIAGLIEDAYRARAFEYGHQAANAAYWSKDREGERALLARSAAARAAAARPTTYTDLDRLLADPRVEAVVIATPHHLHAPLSAQALAAGKHVFCEGPIAINLEQADRAIEAWRASGKVYTIQYYSRFFRGSRQAYRLARSGKLGTVLMGRGDTLWYRTQDYFDRDPWRGTRMAGDRVYVHHGRYSMDLFLWIMDDPIEEVYAQAGTKTHRIEVEDNAAVQVRFRSGAYGQLMLSTSAHPPSAVARDVERFEVLGERASMAGTLNYATEDCDVTIGSREPGYAEELRRWADDEPPMPDNGPTTSYAAFVDAVRGGPPMLMDPPTIRRQIELARAIGRSLVERRPVSLPINPGDPFYGPVAGYDP